MFVEYTLRRWGAGFLIDDAVRKVDELVTNAVKATGVMDELVRWTEVTHMELVIVRVLGFKASIRIEVWDSGPNLPVLPDAGDSPIKRGCYSTVRGKVVWVELPVLSRGDPARSVLHPTPEELPGHEADRELLRRVRDGLKGLGGT